MKIKIIFFTFLFLSTACSIGLSYVLSSKNHTVILSPLPNKTYAKTLGVIATPTNTPSPTPTPIPPTSTPTTMPTPIIITSTVLDELFTKYSSEYSVDKELMKRIAYCESGLNPNANTSQYAGLYQFSESLWISTRTLMRQNSDPNIRFNAEEAIRTAAFMISQNHLYIWPNCNK